jgi:hypothetical protein
MHACEGGGFWLQAAGVDVQEFERHLSRKLAELLDPAQPGPRPGAPERKHSKRSERKQGGQPGHPGHGRPGVCQWRG